jgi:hypothetical protein
MTEKNVDPTKSEATVLPLPFKYFGHRVVETTFSLSGTLKHPEAQPQRAYTTPGEVKVFVVVAFTDGQETKPADGERTLTWANKLKLAEAFELAPDADLYEVSSALELVERLREEVRAELEQLGTGDTPDHAPADVKKARTDQRPVTLEHNGETVETTVGGIKEAAARTRRAAKAKASA